MWAPLSPLEEFTYLARDIWHHNLIPWALSCDQKVCLGLNKRWQVRVCDRIVFGACIKSSCRGHRGAVLFVGAFCRRQQNLLMKVERCACRMGGIGTPG